MSSRILHFTLGPVQGFVAQARRTRDLWGGSFLLSWLSGIAMRQVLLAGGRVVFPVVHDDQKRPCDPLLAAILSTPLSHNARPIIGSLPNRFKAEVPIGFDPSTQIGDVVKKTFEDAAEKVLETYIKRAEHWGYGTRDIWDRQIKNFWEIAWVVGDPGDRSDATWLDARKNWRVPASQQPEGGDHCTVMHAWQELSGRIRARERKKQDLFWEEIRKHKHVGKLDLREDERLCAIAFVKRMLPRLAEQDQSLIGWKVNTRSWPSTAYLAAVPWIKEAWEKDETQARKLAELARAHFEEGAFGERDTRIACLEDVDKEFRSLDGNTFHAPALSNEKTTPLRLGADRAVLFSALTALIDAVRHPASPFYALLLMDGDALGVLLRKHAEGKVSEALAKFTGQVSDVVSQKNGVTVYAGGDDVLAMLPLAEAIGAACELERRYCEAFAGHKIQASISGAIVFAHFKQPLQAVLREAHHLLDHVAKEDNGRASLAVSVLQGAGKNIEWVATWQANGAFPPLEVRDLATHFHAERQFSTRFFYGLTNLFGLMRGTWSANGRRSTSG